jgi:hypothetical protein
MGQSLTTLMFWHSKHKNTGNNDGAPRVAPGICQRRHSQTQKKNTALSLAKGCNDEESNCIDIITGVWASRIALHTKWNK